MWAAMKVMMMAARWAVRLVALSAEHLAEQWAGLMVGKMAASWAVQMAAWLVMRLAEKKAAY